MPIIHLIQQGQPVADFSANGAIITVAGVEIDCNAHQNDNATTIEIRQGKNGAQIGGTGAYIAAIEIPAKSYIEELAEDEDGNQVSNFVAQALDHNAITIHLWPTV